MAALYSHTTRATGTILTATIYNGDHENHIDNGIPTMLDDYSSNAAEMRTQTDPGESGSESLSTNLAGELSRLRFAIAEIKGKTYWYETAAVDLTDPIVTAANLPLSISSNTLSFDHAVLRGYVNGLTLSNNTSDATNDIDIAAGVAMSDDNTYLMKLSSTYTKQLDAAWAVGSAAGARDTGSIADDWWFVWLIARTDTNVVDVLFSTSATAPTMPTNYTKKRLVGMFLRTSSAIFAFTQIGDNFRFKVGASNVSNDVTNFTSTARLQTLTVPDQIKVFPNIMVYVNSSTADMLITSPDDTDSAVATTLMTIRRAANGNVFVGEIGPSDTSGRLRFRTTSATASDSPTTITTLGFRFPRASN